MRKINKFIILLLSLYAFHQVKAEKRKILFIGNSYTSVNDLPGTLKSLALSLGDSLDVDSYSPGGMTLNMHWNDPNTLAKIALGGWNYVVVQAQSQEPSFDPTQVATDTYPYAKKLDSFIHIHNPCAETMFYMTWGRKNGDASNCSFYPPICTYQGMQQRLRESYLEMSLNNNASCVPAGMAWKHVRDLYPTIELYQTDESHPIENGTYLIACTFYSSIYHKSSVGASYLLGSVTSTNAAILQQVASSTVLDSIENWQQHGSIPHAKFSSTINSNSVSFNNQSLRSTQYEWNFGDASGTNFTSNPTHVYATIGNYPVTLKALNACAKYDIFVDTVHVTSVVNGINNSNQLSSFEVSTQQSKLTILNNTNAIRIEIYDLNGKLIEEYPLTSNKNHFHLNLVNGIYFYNAINNSNQIVSKGRFLLN